MTCGIAVTAVGHSHPRVVKAVVDQAQRLMHISAGVAKYESSIALAEQLATIAGQRPVITRAKNSIAGFKLREGMPIGCKVTLRGARMWEFLDRLMTVALPRIRDFRGLDPRSFDGRGNYSIGIREQIVFPENGYDAIANARGCLVSTSDAPDELRCVNFGG